MITEDESPGSQRKNLLSGGLFFIIATVRDLVRSNFHKQFVDAFTNEYQHFITTPSNQKKR